MMRGMGGPGGGVVNPGNAISHEKKRSALWKLMGLMKPYWPVVAFCCVLGIVLNLANILKPYLMKIAVDEFIGQYEGLGMEKVNELTKDANWFTGTLTGLGVTYFLVILGGQAAGYAQSLMMTKVCQTILHSLRMKAFYHIHHMKLKDLDAMGSGRLLTRSTNDIEALDEFYGDILLSLFKDVFLLGGILAAMFLMSWRLALVSLVMVPAIFAITVACRGALRRNFVKMKALTGRMNGFIAESLSGIRVIQAFNREKEKYAELDDLNRQYLKASIFQVFMNSVLRPVMEVINSVGIALVLCIGFRMIGRPVAPLEVGVLVAFNTYIRQFFGPINDLAEKYNNIQSSLVSADRVFDLIADESELEDPEQPGYEGIMRGEIEFRDVWFAYEGEDWVLRGLNFSCKSGDKLAFVGATGAGKTTIISLLSRFYVPQKGEIRIDGVPLNQWNLGALRRQIGVVLQDVFLFVGTVADNVRIHGDISPQQVRRAVEIAHADGFVDALPGGMEHRVAERGATFSTGERQLLSFARAIAHDPRVLVLDEATANIDSNTEELIQNSIADISQGRTSIFIAHRLSTIRACDKIYYLEKGVVAESGTHEELMALGGRYRALVEEQG
ncbi:MAG: ABC transporter ATP-binding protein/permease [Clostridiales bacterium]|nr:ABC transporter ATP-binding protein/permease [Clostridiales bacterium]